MAQYNKELADVCLIPSLVWFVYSCHISHRPPRHLSPKRMTSSKWFFLSILVPIRHLTLCMPFPLLSFIFISYVPVLVNVISHAYSTNASLSFGIFRGSIIQVTRDTANLGLNKIFKSLSFVNFRGSIMPIQVTRDTANLSLNKSLTSSFVNVVWIFGIFGSFIPHK